MRIANILPDRQRERGADRPARRRIVANARSYVEPPAAARWLDLAIDPLAAFPFAGQLDERIPARMGVLVRMLVELVSVVEIPAFGMLVRGRPEVVRQCDPALEAVAKPRALRAPGRELIERARGQL